MQLREFHYQMLADFVSDLSARHQVEFHIGGVLEYADCDSRLLQFLSAYVVHQSAYCMYVKSSPILWNGCIRCKQKVIDELDRRGEPYFGVCHCGVGEYLAPIFCRQKAVGFVSAGGFRPDDRTLEKRLRATARRFNFSLPELRRVYEETIPRQESPDKSLKAAAGTLSLLFSSLADDLQLWNAPLTGSRTHQRMLMQQALEYIHIRYARGISIHDIARFCCCSPSYLQHIFKKYSGETISAYLENLRMEKARLLLENSELSVGQVAAHVGYRDPNYFSAVFAKSHHMSPTAYRGMKGQE